MSSVDSYCIPSRQVPQACSAVRRRTHEISRIHGEDTIPNPLLVPFQRLLELEILQAPQLDGLIARRCREVLDVRTNQALEDVTLVSGKLVQGLEVSHASSLTQEAPDEARSIVVRCNGEAAIISHTYRPNRCTYLRDELTAAGSFGELPDSNVPVLVTRNQDFPGSPGSI